MMTKSATVEMIQITTASVAEAPEQITPVIS